MAGAIQEYIANITQKALEELEAAVLRVPEEKRSWSPMDKARTALDQAAECAILNGYTADRVRERSWRSSPDFNEYQRQKAELAKDWEAVRSLLHENTAKVIAAIRELPDENFNDGMESPFGPLTLGQIIAYPQWNMTYHLGQINYIASMLGCL